MDKSEFWKLCQYPHWRMRNLYYITDKSGIKTKFRPNWAQEQLEQNVWYKNVILKARQLGISTYLCLLFLDRCLFNSNMSAGIIAHTREDAEQLFKRVKFAYENLPSFLKDSIRAKSDRVTELMFDNGSSIRVGTSMRSSTLQYLHISEFGKICAKYPDKAEEIITGSLNTIAPDQFIFIESTAEGREGYFYEMCKKAEDMQKQDKELTQLDYKFHFFPWWGEQGYRIGSNPTPVTTHDLDYFKSLELREIKLDPEQKNWYLLQKSLQGENMVREFPSTPSEAWESVINGAYYAPQMALVRSEKRIGFISHDNTLLVHTAWDLGFNDSTAIWFFQVVGKEIHLIEYLEGSGESLAHWLSIVKSKKYSYGKHLGPHDILSHEYSSGLTRQASARKMGFNFIPSTRSEIVPGIDAARALLSRCFFDESKCARGIQCLENYKKKWNERTSTWSSEPLHNQFSHGADAFRTLATGLSSVTNTHSPDGHRLGTSPSLFQDLGYPSSFRM